MTHASGTSKTLFTRLVQAFCLCMFTAFLWAASKAAPHVDGALGSVAALGFLLLAGTLVSELLEVIRLPHLVAYLIAGMAAGPHVLHVVDHRSVNDLSVVNAFALSLIALAGGAELELGMLRRGARSLAWATLVQTLLVFVATAGVFWLARPLISFAPELTSSGFIAVAMLWGVLSVSRSPAAVLAILSQTRAKGPLASHTLAFVMLSDVVVVVLLAATMTVARPMLDSAAAFSLHQFRDVGRELLGSVSIGTLLGMLLAAHLRFIGARFIVVLAAFGLGVSEILRYLRFDVLLAFLTAGFVVRNIFGQGELLLREIEQASKLVFVVFFATAGAHLDLPLLAQLWPVALLLTFARALATFVASKMASRLAHDEPVVARWNWGALVSQAGLTLGLSVLIEKAFPTFGSGFRALAVATVAINEMVGPILYQTALSRAGELSRAPAPARPSVPDAV